MAGVVAECDLRGLTRRPIPGLRATGYKIPQIGNEMNHRLLGQIGEESDSLLERLINIPFVLGKWNQC